MADEWRVYVVRPRPNGREGRNYTLVATPPAELQRAGVQPKRKTAKTPDAGEADRRAAAWARSLNSSVLPGSDPEAAEVLARHVAWREVSGGNEGTLEAYRQALRRLRPLLGALRSSQVTRAELLRVRDGLLGQVGAATAQQTLNCLAGAWRWAVEREWVAGELPRVQRLRAPDTDKRPLEDAEVARMLAWVAGYQGGYWLPLFALLADAGSRITETLALLGRDVDREAGVVRLRGKGGKVREVPVPAETLAALPDRGPSELVFQARRPGARRGRPLSRRVPLGVLWLAAEACLPDPDRVDLHSFRRAWISSAHAAGVPMLASMRVTGHTSMAVHAGYARRARHAAQEATRTVRELRGARPWEGDTAEHRRGSGGATAPNSSEIPLESRALGSCWSGAGRAYLEAEQADTCAAPAREQTPNSSDLAGLAPSPFCGAGHPLGARIEALVRLDAEAALALALAPEVRAAIEEWARRTGYVATAPGARAAARPPGASRAGAPGGAPGRRAAPRRRPSSA